MIGPAVPEAVIERHGRWRHLVYIRDGMFRHGEWWVFGAARAERKAHRELARYMRRQQQPPTRVVGLDSLPVPPPRTSPSNTTPPDFDG